MDHLQGPRFRARADVVRCIHLFDDLPLLEPSLPPALERTTQRTMSVKHSNDEYTLRLDQVDEAVGADDEHPEPREFKVGDLVAPVREPIKRLGGVNGKLSQIGGIRLGVLGNELNGRFQILDGGVSPDYLASHLERRFFTCSWLWTRPAAAASMLRWTFCRT